MENLLSIKGVGEKTEKLLNKLGIYEPSDLFYYFPRDYEEFREYKMIIDLKVGEVETVKVKILNNPVVFRKKNLTITSITVSDGYRNLKINWFNIPFIKNNLTQGKIIVLRGKTIISNGKITISQPHIYDVEKYEEIKNQLSPIYKLTKGISNETIKKIIKKALDEKNEFIFDYIPNEIRLKRELASGVQTLQYQINPLMTTNGQTPFVTIFSGVSSPIIERVTSARRETQSKTSIIFDSLETIKIR